ncbi:MAG: WD40 repeat domain-containing protein [Aggregatilineales bacterium]
MPLRKIFVFSLALMLILITGILLSQEGAQPRAFSLIQQIGRQRPTGLLYNAHLDQLVMVDTTGQLVLTDAATMTTDHILYERGPFNEYVYSHDGNFLALALDRRIEIWDARTGEINVSLEPEGVLAITGPLEWADDDTMIRFDTVVPEPAATRVSENDTSIVPWLWDIAAARDEAPTRFANRTETRAFPDFRYGYILGTNDVVVAGLPGRLQLIDTTSRELPVINEIQTRRNERDPISLWQSMRDDLLYLNPINENRFVQIDTTNGNTFEFTPGSQVSGVQRISEFQDLQLSNDARIIGDPLATTSLPLLELIFGVDYQRSWNYNPITVMLLDAITPITQTASGEALLMYVYDERRATGTIDLVRLPDVSHMAFHPDNNRLIVRRVSGAQQIEIYDLNTGLLERTIYPLIPDNSGNRLFALTEDGATILSDFERFDTLTGEVLRQDTSLLGGFDNYYFSQDGERLITLRGTEWLVWDIANSEIIREETVRLRGEVVDVSADGSRYLTRDYQSDSTSVMEIVDVGTEIRKSVTITAGTRDSIILIEPSPDWTRFIVGYSSGAVALYDIDAGRLHYIARDEILTNTNQFGWVDNNTAYINGSGYPTGETRIYGIDYHATGLPMCIVDAYPDTWQDLVPLWERYNAYFDSLNLDRFNRTLCNNLPESVPALIENLTPTPRISYYVESTRPAYAVPGVPICITQYFTGEALAFADLWRDISAGLTEDETAELTVMICEGLIGSLSGVSATATPDPLDIAVELTTTAQALRDNPPTATLGAEDSGGVGGVMLIDAISGERSVGGYLPEQAPRPNMQLVNEAFQLAQGYTLNNPRLSQDGRYVAGIDPSNFLVVYRIDGDYTGVAADATGTIEARRTGEARVIGLRPTATATFAVIGTARPTITPTITPTSPPTPQAQFGDPQTTETCDVFTNVHTLADVTDAFSPTGTLIMRLPDSPLLWQLDPATGEYHPDETLPRCLRDGNCTFSPDHAWLLSQGDDIRVTDVYGNVRRVLFEPQEAPVFPASIYWLPRGVIEFAYGGYDEEQRPVTLYRRYDPVLDELSEPFERPEPFAINELQTDIITEQPNGGSLAVAVTYFYTGTGTGLRYYLFDRATESVEYFARLTQNNISFEWNRAGDLLYYRLPDADEWFVYEVNTGEHQVLRDFLPLGPQSRDGRYTASWITPDTRDWDGGQVPKLSIWDSETNATRTYCLPETGFTTINATIIWSPDSRYIAYRYLPYTPGDWALTPTAVTTNTPTPVPTLSLEEQYDASFYRVHVLDLQTGEVVEINDASGDPMYWLNDESTLPTQEVFR